MTITPETCSVCGVEYVHRRGYRHNTCQRCYNIERNIRRREAREQKRIAREQEPAPIPMRTVPEAYTDFVGVIIRDAIRSEDFEFLRTTGRLWAQITDCDLEAYDERINDIECQAAKRKIAAYLRMASKPAR